MNLEEKQLKQYEQEFDDLIEKNEMNISNIENLMTNRVDNFKHELLKHTEELIIQKINEKKLISKKNKNGKTKDID